MFQSSNQLQTLPSLQDGQEVRFAPDRRVVMNRRQLLSGLAAGTVVAVSGCVENKHLGRSQLMLVSDDELAVMSAQTWQQVLARNKVVSPNASESRRLRRVGTRVVDAAKLDSNKDWEFVVLDDPTVNAFVLPGGQVAFYSGIMDAFANEHQDATVMGHEVGYVAARHSAERASQQMATGIGLTVVAVTLGASGVDDTGMIAAVLGAGVTFGVILPYSRQHEYEADRLGVQYMAKAGYRPRESLEFWRTMASMNKNAPMEFMSTHPSDANRIRALQTELRAMSV